MRNDFNIDVDHVAAMATQDQERNFDSYDNAQQHFTTTRNQILESIQEGNAILVKGLEFLQNYTDHGHSYVADMAAKILRSRHAPNKLKNIIEIDILDNELSLFAFTEAVNSYVDCGDYEKECCVIAVLMTLYPVNPQPYVCFGILIWRRDGIREAADYYSRIIDALDNPVLDYFAADCFLKNGNKSKAREVIFRALATAEKSPEQKNHARKKLFELLAAC